MKQNIISIAFVFFSFYQTYAQKEENKTQKVQVSFAYPIGSNGSDAAHISNNFSFNILYGINGGVKGFELGSLFNINNGNVKGVEISGISSLNKEVSKGIILAGISNHLIDSTSGIIISGVLNTSNSKANGVQISTINYAKNEFVGVQLAVINYAKKLKGVQLGIINILNDDLGGIPVGLINIVKNGLFELELTAGEALYANINYKMGVKRFYTLYKLGTATFKNNSVYSLGIGFGSYIPINANHTLSIDLSTNSLFYNNKLDGKLNLLNKLDFNYKYSIGKKISILIGPSFNMYVSEQKVENEFGTLNIPYTLFSNTWSEGKLYAWIGFNAGVSFVF